MEKCHPILGKEIYSGNFNGDPYTFIEEDRDSNEEYLIFIIHGIGQTAQKLKSKCEKIKNTIHLLYTHKKYLIRKQLHVRIINWKYLIQKNSEENCKKLIDINNETKYPKLFINQIPQDLIYYLSESNRYEILNDIIAQMNDYYNIVKRYRRLFKGGVSVVGHSLGGVIIYDICKDMGYDNEEKFDTNFICNRDVKVSRKERKENLKIKKFGKDIKDLISKKENFIINNNDKDIQYQTVNNYQSQRSFVNFSSNLSIISKNVKISTPLSFSIDNIFFLGSPLSLFISIEDKSNPVMKPMQIVKDFHNIIHPMDPFAYRIEPLIKGYQEIKNSFLLPHWENDGVKNLIDIFIDQFNCFTEREKTKKIKLKRYDFMVQESIAEKSLHIVGILFSHTAYWNNPDVFYFIIKMIHLQGYNEVNFDNLGYKDENNYKTEAL